MTTPTARPFGIGQSPRLASPNLRPPPFFTQGPFADISNNQPIQLRIPKHISWVISDSINIYLDKLPLTGNPSTSPIATIPVAIDPATGGVAAETPCIIPISEARKMLDRVYEINCESGSINSPHVFHLAYQFGVTFT